MFETFSDLAKDEFTLKADQGTVRSSFYRMRGRSKRPRLQRSVQQQTLVSIHRMPVG